MENKFHTQFYRPILEVTLLDLAIVKQYNNEAIDRYVAQFKKMRNQCLFFLPEKEVAEMAKIGLKFALKEHLAGKKFSDLFSLTAVATQYENLWKEKEKKPFKDYKQNVAIYDPVEDLQEDDDQEAAEIAVAKMTFDKPYVCQALKPAKLRNRS